MASYVIRIGTADGAITTRTVDAADEAAARQEMSRQGARIFSISSAGPSTASTSGLGSARGVRSLIPSFDLRKLLLPGRARRVKLQEFLIFNQELVALLHAGLPIVTGIETLLERQQNEHFKRILTDVRDQLVSGVALSDAFLSHGDAFPKLYATSLKAGERSGEVEAVLRRYLSYQKILGAVRRKVISALVYPSILIMLSAGLLVVLMTFVIPRFTEFYASFGGDLPLITKVVLTIAAAMKEHFGFGAVALTISAIAFFKWKDTEAGRRGWDGFLLSIPIVGNVLHQFAITQFSRSFATLVGAGTPVVPALEIASGSISNTRVAEAVTSVVPKVREGAELWRSLENTGQFTSLAVEMIKVGEATGALEAMLMNVSEFYDETIETSLQRLINLIEPVILILMAGVISVILLSIYLPMFTIINNIKG